MLKKKVFTKEWREKLSQSAKKRVGKNSPNYIDGRSLKKYYCIDCGKEVSQYNVSRCRSCATKHYIKRHGIFWIKDTLPKPTCIDCGKIVSKRTCKRCHSCNQKNRWKNDKYRQKILKALKKLRTKPHLCENCGKKVSRKGTQYCHECHVKIIRGEQHHNYKGGKPKCLDCGKQLSSYSYQRCDKCNKKYFSGRLHHNYKNGLSKCIDCGQLTESYHASRCRKCYKIWSSKSCNNPNWRGGISFEPYPLLWTDATKERIRERDNHTCQLCGKTQKANKRALHVHHIDYNKKNCKSDNLIALCSSCHMKTNYSREHWKQHFKGLIV